MTNIPELADKVSDTKTPMHYTAAWVRDNFPDAVRVFIGPCIAKRQEALEDELIDYVLTFEELGAFFISQEIDVQQCAEIDLLRPATNAGRRFPVSGGVTTSLAKAIDGKVEWKPVLVDGLTKKELMLLKAYAKTKAPGNFVEVMSCEGGCVAGPGVICPVKISKKKVEDFVKE